MSKEKPYCNSLTQYSRFETREVMVGKVGIGGDNPIRVQSMTTADTMDTKKSVEETISLAKVGCEIVRL
ncbi:MAG: flavodoxin-dependent (E)-4-hydroxy-3-methylbut-2-enyl-diphosphate synthase, partial [Flavobacteriales bacterium]